MYWSRHAVRLRKETWIEILSKLIIAHCYKGSSPKGDVIWNIFSGANSLGFFCSSPCGDVSWNIVAVKRKKCHWEFVSLRRRELKFYCKLRIYVLQSVRLLAETWVEMENNLRSIIEWSGSSPCGDVNWNNADFFAALHAKNRSSPQGDVNWNGIKATNDPDYSVHPRKGMWIEISSKDEEDDQETRSSPCGDVNWNYNPHTTFFRKSSFVSLRRRELKCWGGAAAATAVRLLTETWVEIPTNISNEARYYVRLLAETWVEIFDGPDFAVTYPVRLLAETWIEMQNRQAVAAAAAGSSPCGDVNWNRCIRAEWNWCTGSSPSGDVSWNEVVRAFHWCICVRLLTETWVEICHQLLYITCTMFVSLRRRELKFLG